MSTSDWIAIASLAVATAALAVSWFAIGRANKTTSAASLVALNEGFRQALGRFLSAEGEAQAYELAELLNLFELACAIYLEKSLTGNSRKLMFEYINNVLQVLVKNEYTNTQVGPLLQSESTFIFIRRFLNQRVASLSVTVPPKWYQKQLG